ncbi:hypothetical protein [Bradyrhizobium diazoefficiens]|uniref:Uncharacterized protein n=1 Tax=Bradyrhizobium diazoefficiens TaxID=1355477 RepID=A0A809YH63_9BRAD|nr:hypothetical protein [Bradyrhizobium diazoefficiens]BCA04176.1 hypothetical protein H12S4_50800 [Bradyrhizobium diazoefficiens]BCA21533.1 hypothetical protein BDHH15_47480 [Bradyrhizobium diazoefficiens]BCE39702.1 hypothetical protein XF3B_47330 [Bradyrhizobium diazoefficiens]BCF53098.1 hypothetical protein XF17B_47360 [Bradyrhizobium diazoefficiens]
MIVVRVELHSAITREVTEIARMHIRNRGGTEDLGDYAVDTVRGRTREQLDRGACVRSAEVNGYPRLRIHVWHLVARALIAMNYAGAGEKEQQGDLFAMREGE